jgi:hypothetical protein
MSYNSWIAGALHPKVFYLPQRSSICPEDQISTERVHLLLSLRLFSDLDLEEEFIPRIYKTAIDEMIKKFISVANL